MSGHAGDRFVHAVLAGGRDPLQPSRYNGGDERPMLQAGRLDDMSEYGAGLHGVALGERRRELPGPIGVERRRPGADLEELRRPPERAQHPVEDTAQEAGAQLRRERPSARLDRIARPQAARVLVHLHGCDLPVERDDLPGIRASPTSTRSSIDVVASPATWTTGPLTRTTVPDVISTAGRSRARVRRGSARRAPAGCRRDGGCRPARRLLPRRRVALDLGPGPENLASEVGEAIEQLVVPGRRAQLLRGRPRPAGERRRRSPAGLRARELALGAAPPRARRSSASSAAA